MGQISYPILNRYGYSMYWDNMWDNLQYYNKFFRKSLFFNFVFFNIFNFYLSLNFFFYTKNFYKNLDTCRNKYKNFYTRFNLESLKQINSNYGKNLNNTYPGKVWIFSIEQWYIISVLLYNSIFMELPNGFAQTRIKNIFPHVYYNIFIKSNLYHMNKYKTILTNIF
jgi:hypothetical protein